MSSPKHVRNVKELVKTVSKQNNATCEFGRYTRHEFYTVFFQGKQVTKPFTSNVKNEKAQIDAIKRELKGIFSRDTD